MIVWLLICNQLNSLEQEPEAAVAGLSVDLTQEVMDSFCLSASQPTGDI